jgi:hypothetical protein
MTKGTPQLRSQGPFRADQIRSGDPYELSNSHPIHCLTTGGRGAKAANVEGGVLAGDPAVQDEADVSDDLQAAIANSDDPAVLRSVLRRAGVATSAEILDVLRA